MRSSAVVALGDSAARSAGSDLFVKSTAVVYGLGTSSCLFALQASLDLHFSALPIVGFSWLAAAALPCGARLISPHVSCLGAPLRAVGVGPNWVDCGPTLTEFGPN